MYISIEEYIKYWNISKESTSSSISGLHFWHCKEAALPNKIENFHSMLTQICFKYGDAFGCHRKGLTVTILNISSETITENLREILIF